MQLKVINSLIIILLTIQLLSAQESGTVKISGEYTFAGEDTYMKINLYTNGRFTQKFQEGLLKDELYGYWELRRGKLILDYFLPKKIMRSKYHQNHCETSNMSDTVFFYIYDQNGKPLSCNEPNDDCCLGFYLKDESKVFLTRDSLNIYKINKSQIPKKVEVFTSCYYKDFDIRYNEKKGNCIHLYFAEFNYRKYKRKKKYSIENGVIRINDYIKLNKQDG